MRLSRSLALGTAALALLAVGGIGTVVGQDEVDVPIVVTGITEGCETTSPPDSSVVSGDGPTVRQFRNGVVDCTATLTDPRVSGTWRSTFNEDCYYMGIRSEACAIWGTYVLDGPAGGWECTYAGTDDLWGANAGIIYGVCPGAGEFEGLTYVFHHVFGGANDFGDGTSYHGLIYQGPPPPWGPIEPPTE